MATTTTTPTPATPAKTSVWKNLGHFFAKIVADIKAYEPKVESALQTAENAAPVVEAVSAGIPTYGPALVTAEKAGEMVLGSVLAALHAGDAAAAAKLADAGLDETAIQTAIAVYNTLPIARPIAPIALPPVASN
ncbi:MAG TPA: hypothetical protein VKB47_08730 [Terracidiphilus sp.]|nr:hypothetical protein [Terracidiphilus sp.]